LIIIDDAVVVTVLDIVDDISCDIVDDIVKDVLAEGSHFSINPN